ncbi:NmrA-like family domain-containing protein 1 [Lasiodiplodia hormozganensis]|uniref:NmrA-like family domain-containing protein 1 n=1 Tax=Lasiodiplodia hormozganensis TaxID=869390 RepID=A0AA40CJR1_9PEZI|nr:NmrA-like family domain-containing protein 1 [Lasiodiplodia hormozganensis]
MEKKVIVVLGVTGIQGGSVADVFRSLPDWSVRGVTRDASTPKAAALRDQGVEVVTGDLDDVASLSNAFRGASAIFAVTDFWGPFHNPATKALLAPGQTINEYCYDLELQRALNIAKAAAENLSTVERFIYSSLSHAKEWSKGKYTWVYHFDSKAEAARKIKQEFPELAARMSLLQVGLYATNWKTGMGTFRKQADGTFELSINGSGNAPIPMVVPHKDTGSFVHALVRSPPGLTLLGFGQMLSWREYTALWSRILGVKATYREVSMADLAKELPEGLERELPEMTLYMEEFGYDGGDPSVIHPTDLPVECPTTSIEDYIKNEDWSPILKS